jgi:hypothetical protein
MGYSSKPRTIVGNYVTWHCDLSYELKFQYGKLEEKSKKSRKIKKKSRKSKK